MFRAFALSSTTVIAQAEQETRIQLSGLSDRVAASFRGIIQTTNLSQHRDHDHQMTKMNEITATMSSFTNNLIASMSETQRKRFFATSMCIYHVFV